MTDDRIKIIAREIANEMRYARSYVKNDYGREDIFLEYYHTDESYQLLMIHLARLNDTDAELLIFYLRDILNNKLSKKQNTEYVKSKLSNVFDKIDDPDNILLNPNMIFWAIVTIIFLLILIWLD